MRDIEEMGKDTGTMRLRFAYMTKPKLYAEFRLAMDVEQLLKELAAKDAEIEQLRGTAQGLKLEQNFGDVGPDTSIVGVRIDTFGGG